MSEILYLGSSCDDHAELRRINALRQKYDLTVYYTRGENLERLQTGDIVVVRKRSVGKIKRFFALFTMIVLCLKYFRENDPKYFIAKNFDNLIILSLVRFLLRNKKLIRIYEVCDIHPLFYNNRGRIWILLQSILLKITIDKIFVTSPAFIDFFEFDEEKIILWENFFTGFDQAELAKIRVKKWKKENSIIYYGKLRDIQSIQILLSFDKIEVYFAGSLSDNIPHYILPDLVPFCYPDDIADLISIHKFVWCVTGENINENLLLSNRLYDAVAFGCIPIVTTGSYQHTFCQEQGLIHVDVELTENYDQVQKRILEYQMNGHAGNSDRFYRGKYWVPGIFGNEN